MSGAGIWAGKWHRTGLGNQFLITRLGYWIIQDVRQDAKDRSTQLSALRLASAANGNHDKDKEITHWVYFPMKQRKSDTRISQSQVPPPGLHLDNVHVQRDHPQLSGGSWVNKQDIPLTM